MPPRFTLPILALIFCCQVTMAQFQPVDTLLAILDTVSKPIDRGVTLVKLADAHQQIDLEQMKSYLDRAAAIPEYARRSDKALKLKYMYGSLAERKNKFDTATILFEEILRDQEKQITDSLVVANCHYKLGNMGRRQGKTDAAIDHLLQSKSLRLAMGQPARAAAADIVLGIIYKNGGFYDKAITYYQDAYLAYSNIDAKDNMATCILNIANVLTRQKKYKEAVDKYQEALDLSKDEDTSDNLKGFAYGNMSNLYSQMRDPEKALFYSEQSFNLRKNKAPPEEIATSLIGMGNNLRNLKRFGEAIERFKAAENALAESDGLLETKARIHQGFYRVYKDQSQPAKALAALEKYKQWTDSLRQIEIEKEALALNEKYESDKRAQEIALLNVENELQETRLTAQRRQLIGLLGGVALLVTLLTTVFRLLKRTRSQKTIIQSALDEKDILLREIHHRVKNNLQFISSLLGLQTEHTQDPSALGALQEGQDRVQSMALIHQNLYQEENLTGVDVKDYFVKLIRGLFDSYNIRKHQIELQLDIDQLNLDVDTVVPIGLVVNELVSNALKYAFPDQKKGQIKVSLRERHENLVLTVSDDGVGMTANEIASIGNSFGYRLIKVFQEQLRADLVLDGLSGTSVEMKIKKYAVA